MRTPVFLLLLLAARAWCQEAKLEWVAEGLSAKVAYYHPVKIELSPTQPAQVTRMPDGVSNPLFGTASFGPRDTPVEVTFLLDEPDNGPARLWVDRNGSGDLTEHPPVQWRPRQTTGKNGPTTSWSGNAGISVIYGQEKRTLGLRLYRFDKNDPQRQNTRNALFYYRDFGFCGKITFNGKTYSAALVDESSRGDFLGGADEKHPDVMLLIDLNGNGKFERTGESFDAHKPFNIGGTTYEIGGLTSAGAFQLAESSQTVPEAAPPPVLEIGGKPVAFDDTDTAGQPVHFPSDYKGKLVMIDFWATWCGPCRAELPNLTKVYEEYHPRGFEVLGISLDNEKTMPGLAKFTADNHMPWPQICDGKGWDARLAQLYGVHSVPNCWLIDGDTGLIVATAGTLRGAALRSTIEHCLTHSGNPILGSKSLANSPGKPIAVQRSDPGAGGEWVIKRPGNLGNLAGVTSSDSTPARKPVTNLGEKPPAGKPSTPATIISWPKASPEDPLVAKAREFSKTGKFLTPDAMSFQLHSPKAAHIAMPAATAQPLPGRQIAERAAAAYVRVGWIYHCSKCNLWHVKVAGGYAIAKDTVVTAFHVMAVPDTLKAGEGFPVVIRGEDEFLPIVGVLAADKTTDAIVLRVAATNLSALALSANVRIGDTVYCLSDPRGTRGYFSSGIVNRGFTRPGGSAGNPADQRLNVSTDWAPGSSGAAILNEFGNVIGHVARIQWLLGDKSSPEADEHGEGATPTLMTFHEAVPAASVLTLIEKMNSALVMR